jgi:hypothetical protein
MKNQFKLFRLSLITLAMLTIVCSSLTTSSVAAERSLVGIRIFSPIGIVLKAFGDPTFIAPGNQPATVTYLPSRPILAQPGITGGPTTPQTTASMTDNSDSAPNSPSMGPPGGFAGVQPPSFGPGGPNGPRGPSGPPSGWNSTSTTGQGGPVGVTGDEDVLFDPLYDEGSRYYYDVPRKGLIYEFVSTNAGRVVEIKVYGYHGSYKTSLGIGLGSNYAQIVLKYGYPEATINQQNGDGDILTLVYMKSYHVSFRLVRNKVAAISVVAPD